MAISRRQFIELISENELIISPYDESNLRDNHYVIHNDGTISYDKNMYDNVSNVTYSETKPDARTEMVTINIPSNGFVLEPYVTYYVRTMETVYCKHYSLRTSPSRELTGYGLHVTMDSVIDYSGNGNPVYATITTTTPLRIRARDPIAELYLEENEPGVGYVPIGGIIMYSGYGIPYGYHLCDGSHGTPDLRDKFVIGTDLAGIGQTGGTHKQHLTVPNLPAHNHVVKNVLDNPKYVDVTDTLPPPPGTGVNTYTVVEDISRSDLTTEDTGNGEPFDNRPEFYALAFIKRYI